MANISDLVAFPKADLHNHLGAGMRYASFVAWSGFEIPIFPPPIKDPSKLFSDIIGPFIKSRNANAKDTISILQLSILDSIADNVKVLRGSLDASMVEPCNGTDKFAELIGNLVHKFQDRINFIPEIEFGPVANYNQIQDYSIQLLSSGAFKSISAYGPDCTQFTDTYKSIFKIAKNLNLKKRCMANFAIDPSTIMKMIDAYNLDEIQCGIRIVSDKEAMRYAAENHIRFNLCPATDVYYGNVKSYSEHPIRKMVDAGMDVSISTNCMLVFNKSISEQCEQLINAGLFSQNEIKELLEKSTL